MTEIKSAQIVAFYLFDISETVNLAAIPALIGGPAVAARLAPKATTPPYVQYEKPPVSFDGELVGVGLVDGFHSRFRLYDYGVISLALSRDFSVSEKTTSPLPSMSSIVPDRLKSSSPSRARPWPRCCAASASV